MKKLIIAILLLSTSVLSAQSDLFEGKFIKCVFVESFESTNAARIYVGYEVRKYPEVVEKLKKVVGVEQAWAFKRYGYRIETAQWFNHENVVKKCIEIISDQQKKVKFCN